MRAELVTTLERLATLEPAWWDLLARAPEAPPFCAPAWMLPWWACFAPGALATVALWEGDRLAGLAPLYLEDGPWGRRLLPLGIGVTDMLDLMLDPAADAAAAAALLAGALRDVPCEAWSAEEAPPGASVLALPDPPGWASTTVSQSACPGLVLDRPDGLSSAVPSGQRRKWRMARHRADRRGWSVTPSGASTLEGDLAHLARLHAERWRGRGEPGVLADEVVRRFHAEAAPALLRAGLLRLLVLRIAGEVAGVYYGLQRGAFAAAYLGGFDPAFAFESPGTLLVGAALESAAADGVRLFSFLRGQEPYKYGWGAVDRLNQCRLFRRLS